MKKNIYKEFIQNIHTMKRPKMLFHIIIAYIKNDISKIFMWNDRTFIQGRKIIKIKGDNFE